MTDIEHIELAIRRVLAACKNTDPIYLLRDLADELARMREPLASYRQEYVRRVEHPKPVEHPPGYKINWR